MYNSCMDYDEYDASTSSSSLVANNKYLLLSGVGAGQHLVRAIRVLPGCHTNADMALLGFLSHLTIIIRYLPINVHVHLYLQLSAGLPDYYGSRQPAVTVRPFPAIGYICCVRAYRKVGRYVHSSQVQRTEQKTRSYLVAGNLP